MGARAQPRVAIEWSAPSDCGSEGPLVAEIERLLGRSLDETTSALRARITITPNGGRWGMRLVIETPGSTPGERTLEGETCGEVTDAAAIVIALAIDPSAAERITAPPAPPTPPHPPVPPTPPPPGTPSSPPSRPAATPPPVPAPSRRVVRPRAPRRFVRVRTRARREPSPSSVSSSRTAASPRPRRSRPASIAVAVHASTGIALGTVPTVGALVAAGASLTVDWARLDAAFVATLPSETTLDSGSGGGRFHLYAASIDACVRWAFGVWHPRACVGGELGSLGGSSFGVSNPGDGSSLWLAARARGVLAFAVPGARWFRPWIGLSAIVPWDRPRFVIDGRGPVYRPDALSGRAMLGVELEFR